jgi:signal transduction histidine kinase
VTPARAARLAWALWGAAALFATAGVVLLVSNRPADAGSLFRDGLVPATIAVTYAGVGAFIAGRRPGNRVGWVLILLGLSFGLTELCAEYAVRGLVTAPGSLPAARLVAWLQYPAFEPALGLLLPLLVLLFPDGRLPSARWRPVAWVVVGGGLAVTVLSGIGAGRLVSAFRQVPLGPNPLGLVRLPTAVGLALVAFQSLVLLAAAVAVVGRLVRSTGAERQQLQWLAFAGAATAVFATGSFLVGGLAGQVVLDLMIAFIAVGLPAAIAVAVLRHGLFDIDLVIHRSLVYGALALFITGVYVGVVAGAGALMGAQGAPNLALSVVAIAVVAVAFQPVRARLQRLASRLVYGQRASPYEAMAELSHRVARSATAGEVLPGLAEVAARAVGATASRVTLEVPGGPAVVAVWPPGATVAPVEAAAVVHGGERVGEIAVEQPAGEPLSSSQRLLLGDLALQAGLAFRNLRLTAELRQRVDQISARARELRESRERLVTAADAQRRRVDGAIQAGTRRQLEAIAGRLGEAEELLGRDPPQAGRLLNQLADEAQAALDGLRDLARGIFPPLLADRGLVAAVEAHLRKVGLAAELRVGPEVAGSRFDPQVEAALYFCCVEALQAAGGDGDQPVAIGLEASDGWLELTAPAPGPASLRDLADRVEAVSGTVTGGLDGLLIVRVPAAPAEPAAQRAEAASQAAASRSGLNTDLEM